MNAKLKDIILTGIVQKIRAVIFFLIRAFNKERELLSLNKT